MRPSRGVGAPAATPHQRLVLGTAVASSCLVIIDANAVGLALPAIARELGGGLVTQQWVMDGYLLTLGAFILAAGALADRFGRERVLAAGTLAFALTSVLCGVAWSDGVLVAGRLAQGAAGAVITPSALALITAAAEGPVRGRLIGQWTAWTTAAAVASPFIGGAAVDLASWRLVFLLSLIPAALMWRPLVVLRRAAPPMPLRAEPFDGVAAALGVVGLGGVVVGLIEQGCLGWTHPLILTALSVGGSAIILFALRQRRARLPQLPLALFAERNFAAGNAATLWAYAGLGIGSFLVGLHLQQRLGLSAFAAGVGMLPSLLPLVLLSGRAGRLAARIGPRLPMALGPAASAVGFVWLALAVPPLDYLRDVLGPLVILGLGLAIMVSPLTTAVLSAVPADSAGVASAVNNAVARIAALLAIGASGAIVGGELDDDGFSRGMAATAVLLAASAVTSALWITNAGERRTQDGAR